MTINNDFYSYLIGELYSRETAARGRSSSEKTVVIFVEGLLDSKVFRKIVPPSTTIVSAGNKNLFRIRGIDSPKGSVKEAIHCVIQDIKEKRRVFPHLEVYGIVDKDFSGEYCEDDHFFITDTTDCETLLLSCGAFSFKFAPTYSDELMSSVYGLSFQIGCYRQAFRKYTEGKFDANGRPLNIRNVIDEEAIKNNASLIFKHETDIQLSLLLNLFGKSEKNVFYGESSREFAKPYIFAKMREEGLVDLSNTFVHKVKGFSIEKIDQYWNNIRGHDICLCAETVIPNLTNFYVNSSFAQTVDYYFDKSNFEKTNIYQKMDSLGLFD